MTLGFLKNLTKGLLIGDNALPKENDILIPLVAYAYDMIATNTNSMHLLTMDRNKDIIRTGIGEYFMRAPELPESDNDQLDIDDELVFPTAEYIASSISKEKGRIHEDKAERLIRRYNEKVEALMNRVRQNEEGEDYVK